MLRKGSMSLREDVCMKGGDGGDSDDLGGQVGVIQLVQPGRIMN